MKSYKSVLDFGCGCGRSMRHWDKVDGQRLHGTDNNPVLVNWCRKNLSSIAEFQVNQLLPPLDYSDGMFDFVYVIFVFAHLSEYSQDVWRDEVARVLMPGGYLLMTTHGESRLLQMTPDERVKFSAGNLVIRNSSHSGTNTCVAFHPEMYIKNQMSSMFSTVDFIPWGSRDCDQDILLLKKRE
jgi:ubiquinone/menaquinone biosynthesis C-methylase UbiE